MLITLEFNSAVLGKSTRVKVVLPKNKPLEGEKYKSILLLHGLSDDESAWTRHTRAEKYAESANVALIMPDAAKSFYTDMLDGDRYFTFISEEVPQTVRSLLPVSEKRENSFVAGLSMGGYGALKLALKKPYCFAGAAAFSPVCDIKKFLDENGNSTLSGIFGVNNEVPCCEDLYYLAAHSEKADLHFYIAMGLSDELYGECLRFRERLNKNGIAFTYDECEGGHDWFFWDRQLKKAIDFFSGSPKTGVI